MRNNKKTIIHFLEVLFVNFILFTLNYLIMTGNIRIPWFGFISSMVCNIIFLYILFIKKEFKALTAAIILLFPVLVTEFINYNTSTLSSNLPKAIYFQQGMLKQTIDSFDDQTKLKLLNPKIYKVLNWSSSNSFNAYITKDSDFPDSVLIHTCFKEKELYYITLKNGNFLEVPAEHLNIQNNKISPISTNIIDKYTIYRPDKIQVNL